MTSFLTPGVYTEEIPLLPQSVAEVSTAVPAFIGYTERAIKDGKPAGKIAVRVSTLLEYKEIFGLAQPAAFDVVYDDVNAITEVKLQPVINTLYYALELYFKNGGGDCYIVSIGSYLDNYSKEDFLEGLDILRKEDEPTLIMLGEATRLESVEYFEVCQAALNQCEELKDRFCIFDIQRNDANSEGFRNGIGLRNLKYGAAYTPYLQTTLNYVYNDSDVNISKLFSSQETAVFEVEYQGIKIRYSGSESETPKFRLNGGSGVSLEFSISANYLLTLSNVPEEGLVARDIIAAWEQVADKSGFNITAIDQDSVVTPTAGTSGQPMAKLFSIGESFTLDSIKGASLYSTIINELKKQRIILPPSAAVAGAYATIDRERGVWKAPANISLSGVIGPIEKITSNDQERLNVDTTAGKSINAIRSFVGKGTMIWGARTLAGNDNEWRYISVRRLFNMIEESAKKAAQFAVFESNDVVTWLKVKAMIESFLYSVWQQGGLAGSVEKQAYFVNIGLGKTMTQQDILEGKMVVEIGLAAVRPAEFILLRFSHKLQEV